jgi:NADPH-dependent curcumin reductase CurA
LIDESTTTMVTSARPECDDGQALVKVAMLSIDPTIRGWMDDAPGYLPPIEIGAPIRGAGAGVVVESKSERYHVDDVVYGFTN